MSAVRAGVSHPSATTRDSASATAGLLCSDCKLQVVYDMNAQPIHACIQCDSTVPLVQLAATIPGSQAVTVAVGHLCTNGCATMVHANSLNSPVQFDSAMLPVPIVVPLFAQSVHAAVSVVFL
jgi:hypothetical protein